MKSNISIVKQTLERCINTMGKNPQLYAKAPAKSFTRKSPLSFERMMRILLGMGGKSISHELLENFQYSEGTPTASAFVQRRSELLPDVTEKLFAMFADSFQYENTYRQYRLLAVDGSDVQIPTNPNDPDSYFPGTNDQKPYNLLHLNALYDLLNGVYLDVIVRKRRLDREKVAFAKLVDRSPVKSAIVLADRGYESYNVMAHVQEKGWYYLIRVKDATSTGIASGLTLPDSEEFDLSLDMHLTRKQTKEMKTLLKDKNSYTALTPGNLFDFLPPKSRKYDHVQPFCLPFRIVRFQIADSLFETVVTNLPAETFPPAELKKLYALRWGLETAFRTLKYTIGLLHLHAKKVEHILQEIFACLIMYNFSQLITSHVIIQRDGCKLTYKVNFAAAIHISRQFFLGNVSPPITETLLQKYVSPIRPGRNFFRSSTKKKRSVSFAYRIA